MKKWVGMKRYLEINTNTYYSPLYAGIQYNGTNIEFNFDVDNSNNDIIYLCSDTSDASMEDAVTYIYGYRYTDSANIQDKKILRRFLKDVSHSDIGEDVAEFIENGILRIENTYSFSDIGAVISLPSKSDLNKIIGMYLHNYTSDSNTSIISLSLVKEMYMYVSFDAKAARQTLIDLGRYDSEEDIDDIIRSILYLFDKKKNTYELFEMKQFVPNEIRKHFSDYLKFRDAKDRKIYNSLQGITALIYDDFYTSGATVKEAVRYLRSIHNKNKLIVFNLINQKR